MTLYIGPGMCRECALCTVCSVKIRATGYQHADKPTELREQIIREEIYSKMWNEWKVDMKRLHGV